MTMADLGPTLETERLVLRPPCRDDFDAWAALMADAEHVRFIGGAQPPEIAWRALMAMVGMWASEGFAMFSVIEKSTGRWVGRVGPYAPLGWPGTEVGWTLVREACGRGYAVEAATATIDWAIDHLRWTRIIHTISSGNEASKSVATRLGSGFEGHVVLPPPMSAEPVELWAQSADDWRAARRAPKAKS
jgi:RimJ/RimL family protein N-acetyltransferase